MDAKKLFLGLLTATVVMTPFATIQPASARGGAVGGGPRININAQPKQQPKRSNSTGNLKETISKDRLNHRAKAVINNMKKKLATELDRRKQMQYKQDGKQFKNNQNKLPNNGKYTEHTVPPRTGKNRGAERIVKDNKGNQFHTKDHYETFKKITELKRRNSL